MHPIGLVDKRSSAAERQDIEDRFRFLPPEHTKTRLDGFDSHALETIFPLSRSPPIGETSP